MRKTLAILMTLLMLLGAGACAEGAADQLQEMYAQAELLMAQGDYMGAAAKFEAMGAYSDASQMAMYCKAISAAELHGMYSVAVDTFTALGDFKDSKQLAVYYSARNYEAAGVLADLTTATDSQLDEARFMLDKAAELYNQVILFKDAMMRLSSVQTQKKAIIGEEDARENAAKERLYQAALQHEQCGEYQQAINGYKAIEGWRYYKDVPARITACEEAICEGIYQQALALEQCGAYGDAIRTYRSMDDYQQYKDVPARIAACEDGIREGIYQQAYQQETAGQYADAIATYKSISNWAEYKDVPARITACEDGIYAEAYAQADALYASADYLAAADAFLAISGYRDAAERHQACLAAHEAARLAEQYQSAVDAMAAGDYGAAYLQLQTLPSGYEDVAARMRLCYFRTGGNPEGKFITGAGLLDYAFSGGYVSVGYDVSDETGGAVRRYDLLVRDICDGVVRTWSNDKQEAFDLNGKSLLTVKGNANVLLLGENRIAVKETGGSVTLYDTSGKKIKSLDKDYQFYGSYYSSGLIIIRMQEKNGYKYGYMDVNGKVVISTQYDSATAFSDDGIAAVQKGDKYLLISPDGKTVKDLGTKYTSVSMFSDGVAYAQNGKAGCVIDENGKQLFRHDNLLWFDQGRAAVFNADKLFGYMDKTGKLVIDYQYTEAGRFMDNGRAIVTKQNGQVAEHYLIDTEGRIVAGPYQVIGESDGDILLARMNGAFYLIDKDGNVVY